MCVCACVRACKCVCVCVSDLLIVRCELERFPNKLGVKVRWVSVRVNPWFEGRCDLSLLHLYTTNMAYLKHQQTTLALWTVTPSTYSVLLSCFTRVSLQRINFPSKAFFIGTVSPWGDHSQQGMQTLWGVLSYEPLTSSQSMLL